MHKSMDHVPHNKKEEPGLTSNKQWGGRFTEETDQRVQRFSASVDYDRRLYKYDIQGSLAHARMLQTVGVLSCDELNKIESGLTQIRQEIKSGAFEWSEALEDLHMNIEARLTDLIGDTGKKLHTGRSRNDQVATDIRLWLREEIRHIIDLLNTLRYSLLEIAEREADTIMPGFTHLQVAQPITLGHHLMAWHQMFARDSSRLVDCHKRMNECPLGAAALAGTTFPINRLQTTQELGFRQPVANSMDAVSDRDFIIEFCASASLIMSHLSRISEELILWSSTQFKFIRLPDRFCTGSSIMPQKKNPDIPELTRGKTGRVTGHLMGLLMLMKSQPLAYNRDNQEDKQPLFDTVDTVVECLTLFTALLPEIQPNKSVMYEAAQQGFSVATDLADYLVRKQVPFRQAHSIVGQIVAFAIQSDKLLNQIPLEDMQQFSSLIASDVYEVLTPEGSVKTRNHLGGTAPDQVRQAILDARNAMPEKLY